MSTKKPSWRDVKQVLTGMEVPQLLGVLQDLYGFSAENKAFFHSRFLHKQVGNDHLEPYKTRILKGNGYISGHWRIVWMEKWDQEHVDLVEPGYICINNEGSGDFQFGVVEGCFHANPKKTDFDSTWEGSQECDGALGTIDEEGKEGRLRSTIAFWEGDESEYQAIRLTSPEQEKLNEI